MPKPPPSPSCKTGMLDLATGRGPQFESALFFKLFDFLGCKRIRPAAYEMVECLHRQLKAVLVSHANRQQWVDNLLIDVFFIWSTFLPDIDVCATKLV